MLTELHRKQISLKRYCQSIYISETKQNITGKSNNQTKEKKHKQAEKKGTNLMVEEKYRY